MKSKSMISWACLRNFIEKHMERDTSYRASNIYQAFISENGSETSISQKDFAMFLRYQVSKEDGLLKRVSHGIYQLRTDPNDRGIFFTQNYGKHRYEPITDDPLFSSLSAENTEISLDETLDDALNLTRKIAFSLDQISKNGLSDAEKRELKKLKDSLLKGMDTTITGIAAFMAWCDDRA